MLHGQQQTQIPIRSADQRQIAITFDDVPGTSLPEQTNCNQDALQKFTKQLLETIKSQNVPVIGFVTGRNICEELREKLLPKILEMWLDAGFELGNHTFSHFDLNNTPIEIYKNDILRNDKIIRPLLENRNAVLRYFRYPMLHTGKEQETKQAIELFLKEHQYQIAPVTIDNQEWIFARVYVQAKDRKDTENMQRVGKAYLSYMDKVIEFFEEWSIEVLGYEPAQVLLLHANQLNADYFSDLINVIKNRNYAFISLEKALTDKAYQLSDLYVGPRGLSWLHRWAISKGKIINNEIREPIWINELYRKYRN